MRPETISSTSAQPSASGPRTSHRNSGHAQQPEQADQVGQGPHAPRASGRVRHGGPAISVVGGVAPRRRVPRSHPIQPTRARRASAQRGSSWCAASRIWPTSSSITSSRVTSPSRVPSTADDPRHVGTPPLQRLQGVAQQVVPAHVRERPDPLVVDDPVPAFLVVLQDVLDVQVAARGRRRSPRPGTCCTRSRRTGPRRRPRSSPRRTVASELGGHDHRRRRSSR